MLTKADTDKITAMRLSSEPPSVENNDWLADQLLKADAFNKELLQQIYLLRQTLKMVL